ncbi:MAG: hypothetical protein Q8941_20515 [Bacteroidota bacterium]|nr:hypothetical protein [Bacteroidota bacterium]
MGVALNIETRLPLFITAGITPGFSVGGHSYVNDGSTNRPSLKGWDFTLEIPGVTGPLDPATDYTYDPVTDTISLTDTGHNTGAGEKWVIQFIPRAKTPSATGPTSIKYSNGYDVSKVLPAIVGRRRWRQPTRTDFPFTLSSDNIWGTDDLYSPVFEAEHKIVSPYNIFIVQEDTTITQDNFNALLKNMQVDVVLKCLNAVFNKRENLEKKLLFERYGILDTLNPNEGKFVGVRIAPPKAFDRSIQIDNVALKFNADVTFNLYLFHDSQPLVALKTFSVSALANQQTIVQLGEVISYAGVSNKSGSYYLGYFQDDLGTVQAINEVVGRFNTTYNFGLSPVELPALPGHKITINQLSFTIKTHGFNIQVSAFRDFTQPIIDSPYLFDNLIGLQMAADVIELIQNNTRTNKDNRITADLTKQLYTDLNISGATEECPFVPGLKDRIMKEAARVKKEFYPEAQPLSSSMFDNDISDMYGANQEYRQRLMGGVYAH